MSENLRNLQNEVKLWERPWTTEEMIENAPNWNLAGDAGLLNFLEDFSEKMLSKVKTTNDRLNDLIDSADKTSLALQNATNQFMGLKNTQFIESRVYEDDETLPTKQESNREEKSKPTEAERLEEMKQAVYNGLEIVNKYYEKVEIPESDSEDDTDEPNILYRPIDPYIDRPLPYVIGSTEWHKYWHVGLGHSSSDSEIENEQEQFSESESEHENLPERDRSQIPGTSDSESEELPKNKMSKPVANSTFNDNTNRNMFDSSDSETGSLPPQINTVNSNFAEELAAKLGKVETNIQPEVNTKPIKKQQTIAGGLFSDEPPPLDDDDMFVNKNMNSGLFSSGSGLFDDVNDDTDFWNTNTAIKSTSAPSNDLKPKEKLFSEENDEENHIFSNNFNKITTNQPKKSTGLFDEDDDLFSTKSLPKPKESIFSSYKPTAPLVSEEPPELEPNIQEEAKSKKPVESNLDPNMLKITKNRPPSTSESESDIEPVKVLQEKEKTKIVETPREPSKISLFDDTSPLFSDDIFNTSTKKFSSNLFDAEEENVFKEDEKQKKEIKSNVFMEEPPPLSQSTNEKDSLFVNNEEDDDDDLFSTKSKVIKDPVNNMFSKSGLFDDDLFISNKNESKKSNINLFDPNPPDLDESDSKSESQSHQSLDNEPESYGSMNAGRASLFDTEPPQLSNESSGIVKDQSNSRLESEDSSFYPYLTSSRRHSDLFQDQSDSLLTGRNKLSVTDSNLFGKQDLSIISEIDTVTKIDITPSGKESALYENDSLINSSVFLKDPLDISNKKSANLFDDEQKDVEKHKSKNVSLFQDSDSDDDLFSNKNTSDVLNISTKSVKNLKDKNIFQDNLLPEPKKLENNDDKLNEKFNYEENLKTDEDTKVDPKKSLSFEKNEELQKSTDGKEVLDGQILSTGSSPGKLKHNLNINVAALIPGASPPRRQNLEKSASLDSSESNKSIPQVEEKLPDSKSIEKSVSFDHPVEATEILISAVKERAKIPVKRRPSTRRARQEAIRKSTIDFENILTETDSLEQKIDKTETQNILNIANNNLSFKENKIENPLSPSTDEDDILSMPRDQSADFEEDSLFNKTSITKNEDENRKEADVTEDIFTVNKKEKVDSSIFSSSDSENDLFSTKPDIKRFSKKVIASPDEDLFKPVATKVPKQKSEPKILIRDDSLFDDEDIFSTKKMPPKSVIIKKSLFDDDDDNDDIFGGPSTTGKSEAQSSTLKKAPVATSRLKKLSADVIKDLNDPLEALKK